MNTFNNVLDRKVFHTLSNKNCYVNIMSDILEGAQKINQKYLTFSLYYIIQYFYNN